MSILEKGRKDSKIAKEDLIDLVYISKERYDSILSFINDMKKDITQNESLKFYEKSRLDQIKYSYNVLSKEMVGMRTSADLDKVPGELYYFRNINLPGSVSVLMVRHIINVLGTDEQKEKWLPLLDMYRCIGAYAQTELGHGSDVQSLETEAVYDEAKDEFVINSKGVTSYKWWPGELGQLSNIAILYAKTIVNNNNIGVLPILIQLRDFSTHKVLEGVEVGDIGSKLGYSEKENGYLKFTNFRTSRKNLLSKFFDFNSQGELITKGNPKVMYASMMIVRNALLHSSSYHLGKALAISIRYSYFRKQFKNSEGQEMQIIDYQLQQHKLIPLIAKAYAIMCSFTQIRKFIEQINEDIKKSDFSKLQEGHVLLSGGKALYTTWCNNGLIICLQSCGGHGFSHFSGIPFLITNFVPNTILEGENSILFLQVGRYLLKSMGNIMKGKITKIANETEYLLNSDYFEAFTAEPNENFLTSTKNILDLLKKGALAAIKHTIEHMVQFSDKNDLLEVFSKNSAIRIIEAAKLHTIVFTFDYFLKSCECVKNESSRLALKNLALLFAYDQIIDNLSIYTALEVITQEVLIEIKSYYEVLLVKIKPDVLTLTDIFAPDDYILFSALGDQNEKPYENLYRMATEIASTNQIDLTDHYLTTIRAASLKTYPKL